MLAMMDETSARMAWRRMRQFQSRIERETTTNFLSAVGHEGVAGFYRLQSNAEAWHQKRQWSQQESKNTSQEGRCKGEKKKNEATHLSICSNVCDAGVQVAEHP
jgi:hypothetical protein